MRRSRLAALEDEVATLRQVVQEQAAQFDTELHDFEKRLRELEKRTLAPSNSLLAIAPPSTF